MTTQEAIRWYESKLFVNERFRLLGTQNEAAKLALAALRAQEERERNDPLTLEDLREMDGEPVWVVVQNAYESFTMCALVKVAEEGIWLTNNLGGRSECRFGDPFEDGITIYRYKPEPPEKRETDGKEDS